MIMQIINAYRLPHAKNTVTEKFPENEMFTDLWIRYVLSYPLSSETLKSSKTDEVMNYVNEFVSYQVY